MRDGMDDSESDFDNLTCSFSPVDSLMASLMNHDRVVYQCKPI
jgi:hypothetical protein